MKILSPLLALVASVACASDDGHGHAMTIKPIEFIGCDTIPAELPFDVKPMMHEPGFKIFYLVEGGDLIGFKPDSLIVDVIKTADGRDISKKRNGSPAYRLGSFPKASEDGKYGVFSLDCSENQFGHVEQLTITGSIVALTGSKSASTTADLALDAKDPLAMGDYKVSAGQGAGRMFGGDGAGTSITVSGELDRMIAITVTDAGKELKRQGWSGSGSDRAYSFAKASGKTVAVTISWWVDKSERKVDFNHGPATK